MNLGLVGYGKIARDQHIPAIASTDGLELIAVASRNAAAEGVQIYPDIDSMLASEPTVDAVILCQPPSARYEAARAALRAGKHVFLEKPPGATVREVQDLAALATAQGVTLFASWHSRFGAAVDAAKAWLAANPPARISINWKEDIRVWHPGQDWILEAGGFGVFDPGINALSILTHLLDGAVRITDATLQLPENRGAPIAAQLSMLGPDAIPMVADLDFLQAGPQSWDIVAESANGTMRLSDGGNSLFINDTPQPVDHQGEYPAMYRHFADLVHRGQSDVDLSPLQLVADAYLIGKIERTDPFSF